jgi:N12 class adenine-specific DNA methylase
MGFDAYEQLAVDPGAVGDVARSILETPSQPGESYADTQYRSAQQAGATARIQAIKGKQWAARGVPSYQDMQGNTKPVVDDTGSPLSKLDPRHNIAYDSTGSPKKIDFDVAGGSPVLKDPFEGLETTTDPKTGHQYKIAPGLPWRWVSTDAQLAQKAEFARQDAWLSRASASEGRKITLLEYGAKPHHDAINDVRSQLKQLGVADTDPVTGDPLDYDSLVAGINSQFDGQKNDKNWAGNAKEYFGMGGYKPEALKAQADLELQRAAALRAAAKGHAHAQTLDGIRQQAEAVRAQRMMIEQTRLDHETEILKAQGIDISQPPPDAPQPDDSQPQENTAPDGKPLPPAALALRDAQAGKKSYKIDEKFQPQFSAEHPFDDLMAMKADGLVDAEFEKKYAGKFKEAQDHYAQIVKDAGGASQAKALIHGLGPAAAFMAGFGPGAAAGATVGGGIGAAIGGAVSAPTAGIAAPATVPAGAGIGAGIGSVIGGLAAGTMAAWAAHKAMNALGEYSDVMKSLNAAAEMHPILDEVGGLLAFSTGAPKAIANLSKVGKIANASRAAAIAAGVPLEEAGATGAKVIAAQLAKGAAGGLAFEGLARPGFDATVNLVADGLGIEHEQLQSPTVKSLAVNAALGVLLAGKHIQFKDFNAQEVASVALRGQLRKAMGVGYDAPLDPAQVAPVAEKMGMDSAKVAEMAQPMNPQEAALYEQIGKQVDAMKKAGSFDNLKLSKLEAQQAFIPGLTPGKGTAITSATIGGERAEPGAPEGRAGLGGPEAPTPTAPGGERNITPKPEPTKPAEPGTTNIGEKLGSELDKVEVTPEPPAPTEPAPAAVAKVSPEIPSDLDQRIAPVMEDFTQRLADADRKIAMAKGQGNSDVIAEAKAEKDAIFEDMKQRLGTDIPEQVPQIVRDRLEGGAHDWEDGKGLREKKAYRYVIDQHEGEQGMGEPSFYVIRNLDTGKESDPYEKREDAEAFLRAHGKGGVAPEGWVEPEKPSVLPDAKPPHEKIIGESQFHSDRRELGKPTTFKTWEAYDSWLKTKSDKFLTDALGTQAKNLIDQIKQEASGMRIPKSDRSNLETRINIGAVFKEALRRGLPVPESEGLSQYTGSRPARKEAPRQNALPEPPAPNEPKLPASERNDQSKPEGAKPAGGASEVAKTEEGKPGGEPAGQAGGKPDAETVERRKKIVGTVNVAMRGHAKELSNLGHIARAHEAELPESNKSGIALHNGKITVDAAKLDAATEQMTPKERETYINAAIGEEVLHKGFKNFVNESPANRARALKLIEDEPAAVEYLQKHYKGFDALDPEHKAAEIARVIMQGKAGVTTESTWKFIEDLIAHIKRILGNMTDATRKLIADIEARMKGAETEKAAKKPKAEKPATRPERRDLNPDEQRKVDALRAEIIKLIQGRPVAYDMAMNDKGASLARLEKQIAEKQGEIDGIYDNARKAETPEKPKPKSNSVGVNERGQQLYEDENGVRYRIEDGVKISAPVYIVPTRAGVKAQKQTPEGEWRTAEEAAAEKPKSPLPNLESQKPAVLEPHATFAERRALSEKWLNTLSPDALLKKMAEYGIPAKRAQKVWDKARNRKPDDTKDYAEDFQLEAGDDLSFWEKSAKSPLPNRGSVLPEKKADAPKLSPGAQAIKDKLGDLFSAAAPEPRYDAPIPREKRDALNSLTADLIDSHGVDTPEKLATALTELGPKALAFSQNIWFKMKSEGAQGSAEPDWKSIYAQLAPEPKTDIVTPDEQPATTPELESPADDNGDGGTTPGGAESGAGGKITGGGKVEGATGGTGEEPVSDGEGASSGGKIKAGSEGDSDERVGDISAGRGNLRLELSDGIGEGGLTRKFRDNVSAIKTLRAIEAERRDATPEEQKTLARYVGWGGLAEKAFQPGGEFYDEMQALGLSDDEMASARRSTTNAHYTAPEMVQGIWGALAKMGFQSGRITEPAMGPGSFYGFMPAEIARYSSLTGIEMDNLTSRIARALYPESKVWNRPFEKHVMADNSQDLIVSNFPFSDADHPNDPRYNKINPNLHDYFFLKSLDKVRPGGFVVAITSIGTMDKMGSAVREVLSAKANLVAAFRLPNTMFKGNAATEVTTDLIILQKRGPGVPMEHKDWLNPVHITTRTGDEIRINQYFRDNPSNMLGIMTSEGKMYGKPTTGEDGKKVGSKALLSDGRTVAQLIEQIKKTLPENIFVPEDKQAATIRNADELEFDPNSEKDGSFVLHKNEVRVFRGGEVERPRKEISPTTKRHTLLSGYIESGHVEIDDDGTVKRTGAAWPESKNPTDIKLRAEIEAGDITGEQYKEFREVEEKYEDPLTGSERTTTVERQFSTYAFDGDFTKADYERIKQLIPLRKSLKAVLHAQVTNADDATLAAMQKDLNVFYDTYVKENGFLHEGKTRAAFQDDPFYPALMALEDYDATNNETTKTDIFSKRTRPRKEPLTGLTGTTRENMTKIMAQTGKVDVELQAKLSMRDPDELGDEMVREGLVFRDAVTGNYVEREEYLSGNIYEKLHAAEEAAKSDESFRKNIEELTKAIPELRPVERIGFSLGAAWIDPHTYSEFVKHIYRDRGQASEFKYKNGRWEVNVPVRGNAEGFGTEDVSTEELISQSMNLSSPTVRKRFDDGSSVVLEKETKLARMAQNRLKQEFKNFILDNPDIHEPLVKKFNELANAIRPRTYDAPYSTLEGMNPEISLRKHQLDFVWRATVDGKAVAAHVVGGGKTFAFIGAGMEWKRMGLASKPMYIVPNHLLRSGQTASDFYRMYPTAKILTVTERDFTAKRRQRLMARIATGNWDAVLIGHSQIGSIPVSPDLMAAHIQGELAELEEALRATKDEVDPNSKQGKKRIKALEASLAAKRSKMEKLLDPRRADKALYFEELGVDAIIIDEAHEFKNLNFWTKLNNIGGLGSANTETIKTAQLKVKTDYILRQNNGRNLLFATGTPITNTIAEVYLLQKYIAQDLLDAAGIKYFDEWAQMFADVREVAEISPDGQTFQNKAKFVEFKNMQSLITMFRRYVDIQRQEQLNLPVPPLFGGKIQNIVFQPTQVVQDYMAEVVERAEALRGGKVDPRVDNWLKLNTDARKISTDPRLIDANLPDDPEYKSSRIAKNTYEIWKANDYRKGTQIVFCDLYSNKVERARKNAFGEPERYKRGPKRGQPIVEKVELFNVFTDMKDKLIRMGVPEDQIAIIHDYEKDEDKEELKSDFNAGKIRVLLGTTMKLGTGMNLQRRMVAVHSMDANYRPDQMTQREGRGIRQGNLFHEATIGGKKAPGRMPQQPSYELSKDGALTTGPGGKFGPFNIIITRNAVERTLDSRIYQTITTKTKIVEDLLNGDYKGDTASDISDAELRGQEMIAAASGNPLVMERFTLENEVRDLKISQEDFDRRQARIRKEIRELTSGIEENDRAIPHVDALRDAHRAADADIDRRVKEGEEAKQKELSDKHVFDPETPFVVTRDVKKKGKQTELELAKEKIGEGEKEEVPMTILDMLKEPLKKTKNNPDGELELRAFGLNGRLTRKSERIEAAQSLTGESRLRHTFSWNYTGASASKFEFATQYNDEAPELYKYSGDSPLPKFKEQRDYLIERAAHQWLYDNARQTDVEVGGTRFTTLQEAVKALEPKLNALKKGESLSFKENGVDVSVKAEEKKSLTEDEKKNADMLGVVPMLYHANFPALKDVGAQAYNPLASSDASQLIWHIANSLKWIPSSEQIQKNVADQKNQLKMKQDAVQTAFPEADQLDEKQARLAEVVRLTSGDPHARTADPNDDDGQIADDGSGETFSAAAPERKATDAVAAGAKGREETKEDRKAAQAATFATKPPGVASQIWDAIKTAGSATKRWWGEMPAYDPIDKAIGQWLGAGDSAPLKGTDIVIPGRQKAAHESRKLVETIVKQFPNVLTRQAISRYMEADGDRATLQKWADKSKPEMKTVYERALNLNAAEKAMADTAKTFFKEKGEEAQKLGLLGNLLENYVTHFVEKAPANQRSGLMARILGDLASDTPASKLKTKFDHAIKRVFSSMFDLEQEGHSLRGGGDIAGTLGAYAQAANNTVADRVFVKSLTDIMARDGRPMAVPSGAITRTDGSADSPLLIKPHTHPADTSDYRPISHPALRKWKWLGKEGEKDVLVEGELLIHPDLYKRLKNTLGTSALNNVPIIKAVGEFQAIVKQFMLSFSPFHFVQEGTHAIGHKVNPFKVAEIDMDDPATRELVNAGLMLANWNAKAEFGEGLTANGMEKLLSHIGLGKLGKLNDTMSSFLFEKYIPGLKIAMAKEAMVRNMERFKKDLASGKMTREQVAQKTAQQANDAFGEQNNLYAGNNPTRLHFERLLFLAPDFLKSRAKFFADAFRKHGGEQRNALILLAVVLAVTAKLLERMLTGKNDWEKPFSVVTEGREYELRSVPGDVIALLKNRRQFVMGRISPLISRTALEAATGRDWRGQQRSGAQQVKDLAMTPLPLALRGVIDPEAPDISAAESLISSSGLRTIRHSEITKARKLGREWQKANGSEHVDEVHPPSKYVGIKNALEDGDNARAMKEYGKLLATMPKDKADTGFRSSLMKPFSGSLANEKAFVASLDADDRATYQAAMTKRGRMLAAFTRMSATTRAPANAPRAAAKAAPIGSRNLTVKEFFR